MLVVEDKSLLDVDTIAGIQEVRKNPLWWKAKEEKPLSGRLAERIENGRQNERKGKRR